jgi:hypothetical protein
MLVVVVAETAEDLRKESSSVGALKIYAARLRVTIG